jgi:hypothetical protein
VTRCGLLLTCSQNARQAASGSAKLPYSASRSAPAGTTSALASLTVDSGPPLDAGSHVATVSP